MQHLRDIVAHQATQTTFDTYKVYCASRVSGYEFMRKIEDLPQLQQRLKVCGSDEPNSNKSDNDSNTKSRKRKRNDCVWADAFSIQVISNIYNITFLILNEGDSISQSIINPDSETYYGENALSALPLDYPPISVSNADGKHRYIILQLTRRGHYNLIGYNSNFCFEDTTLPTVVHKKFGVSKLKREYDDGAEREEKRHEANVED